MIVSHGKDDAAVMVELFTEFQAIIFHNLLHLGRSGLPAFRQREEIFQRQPAEVREPVNMIIVASPEQPVIIQ